MYRYLVFAYDYYYPFGGMDDCKFKTNDNDEALNQSELALRGAEHVEIYDAEKDELIYEKDRSNE